MEISSSQKLYEFLATIIYLNVACRKIHNFCSRKLATFTTSWMDISALFRPDLYFVWFQSDSNGRHISYFRAPYDYSLISYSFDNQMYLFARFWCDHCDCQPVKLVTPGRDECHGFVIKRQKIHYKRLPDLLWMSSEGINMWGNEGGWDWYFNFGLLSSFCPADWMEPAGSFVLLPSWSNYQVSSLYSIVLPQSQCTWELFGLTI